MEDWKRIALMTLKTKDKYEEDKTSKRFKKKYGFDYRETWNLDYEIACFILPRLAYFKDYCNGYPHNLTNKEWERILDKMIKAFETIVKNEATFTKEEERKIVQEGLNLFGKYYLDLWD